MLDKYGSLNLGSQFSMSHYTAIGAPQSTTGPCLSLVAVERGAMILRIPNQHTGC